MPGVRTATVGSEMPDGAAALSAVSSLAGYSCTGCTRCSPNTAGIDCVIARRFSMT